MVKNSFLFHAQQYADVVSKIITLNATGTIEAEKSIENILKNLLGNTAKFVAYLDMIEPFNTEELTTFTRESGLMGISVIRNGNISKSSNTHSTFSTNTHSTFSTNTHSTFNKYFSNLIDCPKKSVMTHLPESHLYLLVWTAPDYPDCIALGINDHIITVFTESLGLNNIIKALSTVQGIKGVEIEKRKNQNLSSIKNLPSIIQEQGLYIVKASQIVDDMKTSVQIDAGNLSQSINQLKIHFYLFSFFLVMTGIILSFLLHRYQTNAINSVKQIERELAAQRENATLGKSAAAIAHEIRNPLNSLSMGLQRLALENGCSSEAHIRLVRQMFDAVKRANSSVTGLLDYAKSRIPKIKPFILETLLVDILNLYQKKCLMQNIELTLDIQYHGEIASDPELIGQVFENIIKNSVEAQPDGGFLHIFINSDNHTVTVLFKNGNCPIEPQNADKIFEPYFTTRPEGTGLGMAIVRNIVKTLDGDITVEVRESREILTKLTLSSLLNRVG